jgi:putative transposase
VAFLLADLGITKTHSRPYTSTDNPYSESNFKTLKYRPEFPARFDDIDRARGHCRVFVDWYNHVHRHSGIGLMTPAAVHYGQAEQLHADRAVVLDAAYEQHPERFVRSRRSRRSCRPPPGSTSRPIRRRLLTKFDHKASHRA